MEFDELPQPEFEGTLVPDELEVDGDNPNEMTDEQFGLLCDRMRENGWLGGPIITDTEGLIADGEHRWRAAQEIGLSEVPVRQFDIDDATRRLWRQELNKIHGEHDSKRDALEYDELLQSGFTEEVEALTDAADEDLDELLAEIRVETSVGPEYEYDPNHNVYFEDCVEGMSERLEDDSVDMVFTSPPYNAEIDKSDRDRESDTDFYEDNMSSSDYKQFLSDVFTELARVCKPDGHILVNMGNGYGVEGFNPFHDAAELMPSPFTWGNRTIIWYKGDFIPQGVLNANKTGRLGGSWEPIFHFVDEPNPLDVSAENRIDHWDIRPANFENVDYGPHPAPYPVALAERAMNVFSEKGDTILDPFMGSGTTAVAAIQNNRDYVGFELDEEGAYKPIIERRIGEAKRQREASVNQSE